MEKRKTEGVEGNPVTEKLAGYIENGIARQTAETGWLRRLCAGVCSRADLAEELRSIAVLAAVKAHKRYFAGGKWICAYESFAFGMVRAAWRDFARRVAAKKRRAVLESLDAMGGCEPGDGGRGAMEVEFCDIREMLGRLERENPFYAEVLRAYAHRESFRALARRRGMAESTLRLRIFPAACRAARRILGGGPESLAPASQRERRI